MATQNLRGLILFVSFASQFYFMIKKTFFTFLVAAAATSVLISSCSTDVDLLDEYKPITVVYCLLNTQDNTQYIKVNKAYLGEGNALVMAAQNDSINYQPGEIDVTLQKINPSTGQVIQTITCLDTTGIPKDDGLFSNPAQILFYTTEAIDANSNYKLIVNRHDDNAQITSTSSIVGNVTVTYPSTTIGLYNNLTSSYLNPQIRWLQASNARVYNVVVRFTYYQNQISPPGPVDTLTLDYNLGNIDDANSTTSYFLPLDGERYFQFIGSSIPPDNNLNRTANDSLGIIVTAGAEDFYTYILVNEPSIGLIQEKPVFTNISNGTGIFSSRWKDSFEFKMSPGTLFELQNGPYTGQTF